MNMNRLAGALSPVCVILMFTIPDAHAQHQGDVWIGRSAAGQLKLHPQSNVPEDNYQELAEVNGPILWGWSDNDPGFDRVASDDPNNDIFRLESGAQIWLEIVSIDPAFRLIDGGFNILDEPGEATFLGTNTLHVHNTWNINSLDPAYDPEQCTWQVTFILRDLGSTGYAASEPFTFNAFTSVELQDLEGDFDDDADVDWVDFEASVECLDGAGLIPNPDNPAITTCEVECLNGFDFDNDRDVDVVDFAEFQVSFTGN
jgi:hypothetical protein